MFGTVARLKVKPGREQAVIDIFEEWKNEFRPRTRGALTGYLYHSESNPTDCLMVIGFEDRDSYYANAEASGQHEWYQRLRENLTEDPEWDDGRVVSYWHP
jgi:heme-degrading monooxygenase HmoA